MATSSNLKRFRSLQNGLGFYQLHGWQDAGLRERRAEKINDPINSQVG